MTKSLKNIKSIIFLMAIFLLVTGVISAGADLETRDGEFLELLNILEQYPEKDSEIDFDTYLARYDAEIIGFTNLEKGRIDPQKITGEESFLLDHLLVYNVRPGDSLYLIAEKFDTTIAALREKNQLESDLLMVGQKLYIPFSDSNFEQLPGEEQLLAYTVNRGDSLYSIAREYNTTVTDIKEENNLESDMIFVGQTLYIPFVAEQDEDRDEDRENRDEDREDSEAGKETKYIVQAGDSLYLIAQRFDFSVSELREANNLDTDVIYPGQELILPLGNEPEITLVYSIERRKTAVELAEKYNLTAEKIRDYNNLQEEWLEPGMEIQLPFYIDEGLKDRVVSIDTIEEEEKKLLTRAVHSEARGEPFTGQVAVAAVVLNRVEHDYFPDNIEDVIFEPWQFTAVHDGQFWLEPNQQSFVASSAALEGWDPSLDAIFYYNPETAESEWIFYRNVVIEIGQHYFAV